VLTEDYVPDERPSRYIEVQADGTEQVVYRASSLGGCDRAVVAAARGFKPRPHPQWFAEVLDEGRRMESRIAELWARETGVKSLPTPIVAGHVSQWEVELEVGEIDGRLIVVRGHMDDVAPDCIREYKKFRPSTWGGFLAKGVEVTPYYPWQVAVYMHAAMGNPCEFVGGAYDPEKDDITEVRGFRITTPPRSLFQIKAKIAKIERLINEGYGPDEVDCIGSYPCPFWMLHDGAGKGDSKPVVLDENDAEIREAVTNWRHAHLAAREAEKMVETFQKRKKAAADRLNTLLEAAGHVTQGGKFELGGLRLTRVVSPQPETQVTRKAYTLDYWKITDKKPAEPAKSMEGGE
jgi:hypothetical protein